jgi:hypothetical protein
MAQLWDRQLINLQCECRTHMYYKKIIGYVITRKIMTEPTKNCYSMMCERPLAQCHWPKEEKVG